MKDQKFKSYGLEKSQLGTQHKIRSYGRERNQLDTPFKTIWPNFIIVYPINSFQDHMT